MTIFFATFAVFGLAMIGLALGWLLNAKELKGSCGGLSSIPGMEKGDCSCSNPCEKRKKRMQVAAEEQNLPEFKEHIIELKK